MSLLLYRVVKMYQLETADDMGTGTEFKTPLWGLWTYRKVEFLTDEKLYIDGDCVSDNEYYSFKNDKI